MRAVNNFTAIDSGVRGIYKQRVPTGESAVSSQLVSTARIIIVLEKITFWH